MEKSIDKYVGIFFVLILCVFLYGAFFENTKEHKYNFYINKVNNIFDIFEDLNISFTQEQEKYFSTSELNKYGIKDIRDKFLNIKNLSDQALEEIDLYYLEKMNKKYISDILRDIVFILNNKFLKEDIFYLNDEKIIKNIDFLIEKMRFVLDKYNILKLSFKIL